MGKWLLCEESKARNLLKIILEESCPEIIEIYESEDLPSGVKSIHKYDPDIVFLDVEMPIISGFDLLEALENPPQVILITGKPDYALKAFDYDVTDYLHKPITLARFEASVKRAVSKYEQINRVDEDEEHIFVKSNLKKRKVILNDIKWIEALGDYVKVVTEENSLVVLSTMKAFEKELPEGKFLRIHKSYIVNLDKIDRFNSKNVEVGAYEIPLSRNKKTQLVDALNNM